jgi:hypothetical protein
VKNEEFYFFLCSIYLLAEHFRQKVVCVSLHIYWQIFLPLTFLFISISNLLADKSANKYTIKLLAVLSYFVADFSANNLLRVNSANK